MQSRSTAELLGISAHRRKFRKFRVNFRRSAANFRRSAANFRRSAANFRRSAVNSRRSAVDSLNPPWIAVSLAPGTAFQKKHCHGHNTQHYFSLCRKQTELFSRKQTPKKPREDEHRAGGRRGGWKLCGVLHNNTRGRAASGRLEGRLEATRRSSGSCARIIDCLRPKRRCGRLLVLLAVGAGARHAVLQEGAVPTFQRETGLLGLQA